MVPRQANRSLREVMPPAHRAPTQGSWMDPQLASRALALCSRRHSFLKTHRGRRMEERTQERFCSFQRRMEERTLNHSQDSLSPRMVGSETRVDPQEMQHPFVLQPYLRKVSIRLALSRETTDKVRTWLLASNHRRSERALRSKLKREGKLSGHTP